MDKFFLLTENSFHSSYLISKWHTTFKNYNSFGGIIIRENKNYELQYNRENFHKLHQKKKHLTSLEMESLQSLYGEISGAEEVMLRCFGIPGFSLYLQSQTLSLGENINSESFQIWLKQESKVQENIVIFVFLDKILSPWWIKLAKGNIINAHSAVLPYARGMFAIENMAYQGDFKKFQQAAGASIHYVDEGIDTGRIIKAIRFKNPFAFESLSEVKAHSYKLAFDLLIQQAWEMLKNTQTQSVGIKADPALLGPAFSRKNYTPDMKKLAAIRFLEMKNNF